MTDRKRGQRRPIGLNAMRAFTAVMRHGSVTAAARELELGQPGVSRLLGQLESDIGFELFYRDRGRLVPTNDGLMLYEEVEVALRGVDRVASLIDDIAEHRVGELRIVAPPSLSESVLPDIAAEFLALYPDVRLTIDSRTVATSKTMIANRSVDGGFVKLPLDRPDLRPEKVVSSDTVCVMRADHSLAAEAELNPELLRGVPLILLGLGGESRRQVHAAFSAVACAPRVRIETHTVASACALAARGLGVAMVNLMLARAYLRDGLIARPFTPKLLHDYAFVTSADAQPTRLARRFLDVTRDYFARPLTPE